MTQDMDNQMAVVNTVMNIRVPYNAENFRTDSGRILLKSVTLESR
jgi:hypothetical protein